MYLFFIWIVQKSCELPLIPWHSPTSKKIAYNSQRESICMHDTIRFFVDAVLLFSVAHSALRANNCHIYDAIDVEDFCRLKANK